MEVGDTIYHAKCIPHLNEFMVLELKVRTITEQYFVGLDNLTEKSSMQAYPFPTSALEETVFKVYEDALNAVKEEKRKSV